MDKPTDIVWINPDGSLHIETQKFMTLGLPDGALYKAKLGNRTWTLFHELFENYGCLKCRTGAKMIVRGVHDLVNIFLGKPVHDPENFKKFVEHLNHAYEKYAETTIRHGLKHPERVNIVH